MTTSAALIHNDAYDALIITTASGARMHMIDSAETFRAALIVGDEQDLDNWSGDLLDDGVTAEGCGTVIATNDGSVLTVLDANLLEQRREFWRA